MTPSQVGNRSLMQQQTPYFPQWRKSFLAHSSSVNLTWKERGEKVSMSGRFFTKIFLSKRYAESGGERGRERGRERERTQSFPSKNASPVFCVKEKKSTLHLKDQSSLSQVAFRTNCYSPKRTFRITNRSLQTKLPPVRIFMSHVKTYFVISPIHFMQCLLCQFLP